MTAEPEPWSDPRRGADSFLAAEQCVIDLGDERHYYVRANLRLPVRDSAGDAVIFAVWVSLSESSFDTMSQRWDAPDRASDNSYFGYLANRLPGYPDTYLLRSRVHTQDIGIRPVLELEPTEHPLSIEADRGITRHRAAEIAAQAS